MKIIITCEHGGNEIPLEYQFLFRYAQNKLESHEGWDIGALKLAIEFAKELDGDFFYSEVSRLLVELNRSLNHPKLFSDYTKLLKKDEKNKLLQEYYFPYRNNVIDRINSLIIQGFTVFHLSVHSFTPLF